MKLLFGPNPIAGKDPVHKFSCGTLGFLSGVKMEKPQEIEVMIVGKGNQNLTNGYPKVVFLKPVTENHLLIDISGFERSGHMCTETATILSHENQFPRFTFVTPGRAPVHIACNVLAGWKGRGIEKRIPHPVWVDKRVRGQRVVALGVDSLDHLVGVIDK